MFGQVVFSKAFDRGPTIAACAALVVFSFALGGRAEARMDDGDRMTATAQECGYLQDMYDAAYSNYTTAKTQAAKNEALAAMSYASDRWYDSVPGCSQHYGNIYVIKSGGKLQLHGNLSDAATLTQVTGSSTTGGLSPAGAADRR